MRPLARWGHLRNELYPLGFFGLLFMNTLFNQWIVFSQSARGKVGGVGTLLLVGYVLQGLANPVVGLTGDRLRAQWGTRRPLVLVAAVPLLVVFGLLWRQPTSTWLVPVYCVVFAFVMQPYISLLPSIATTERVRLRMTLTGSFCALAAAGAALLAGPLLVERSGFGSLATVGAGAFVLALLVPVLLIREAKVSPVTAPSVGSLFQLTELFRAPTVRRFVVGSLLLTATLMSLVVSAPWVAGAILGRGQSATAVLNGFLVAGMLVSVALLGRLGKRFTPLALMRVGALVGVGVLVVLGAATLFPAHDATLVACAGGFFVLGYLALSVLALPSLVAAKLSDEDGRGREGLFFGLSGVATGFGNALGAFVASTLIGVGRDASDPVGVRATVVAACGMAIVAARVLPPAPSPRTGAWG